MNDDPRIEKLRQLTEAGVLRPFVDRLIEEGMLPLVEYQVTWQEADFSQWFPIPDHLIGGQS